MSDIFISYASQSLSLANAAKTTFEKQGLTVWMDKALIPGRPYADRIAAEIEASRVVVVIWCPQAIRSTWVYSEANRARVANKLVQVLATGVNALSLPPPFDALHALDWDDFAGISRALQAFGLVLPANAHAPTPTVSASTGSFKPSERTTLPPVGIWSRTKARIQAALHPNLDLRVSFAAIFKICCANKFVLVRNLHRPEIFAPIGGVYKFTDNALRHLDDLEFRPESVARRDDTRNDVRGFVPYAKAPEFIRWFEAARDREDGASCLNRELSEEMLEIGLQPLLGMTRPRLRFVRRVEESPSQAPGFEYHQFRIFDVFEAIAPESPEIAPSFLSELSNFAHTHDDLDLVGAEEIRSGRSIRGNVLGHHCAYLFGKRAYRPDAAHYRTK